jgi:hypothetical protein
MYYDFNGKFLQSLRVNVRDDGLKMWVNNYILSMDAVQFLPDFTYKIYNSDFHPIINRVKPLRLDRRSFNIPGSLFSNYIVNDQICIRESVLNDTLYVVDNEFFLFMPKYIISEGKYSYTSDILLETNTKAFFDKTKNHIIINSIFETKDFLFIRFNKKYGYYDKKQDRFFTLKSSMGISNDYDGGLNFWPMHQKNNKLIGFFVHIFLNRM